jgi:hypothetical protein
MDSEPHDQNWEALSQDVLTGMREWRLQHPKATLREIERALDEHFAGLRAYAARYGVTECGERLEGGSQSGSPNLSGLRHAADLARQTRAPPQNLWWPGAYPHMALPNICALLGRLRI